MRMKRAGRKELMLKEICKHDKRYPGGCLPTPKVAHAAGLMSSSNVVKMLRELAAEGQIIEVEIESSYGSGFWVRAWCKANYKTMPLPEQFIVINGQRYLR